MPNIGFSELLLILALVLVLFGPSSIPKIGKAIGEGIREFKKSQGGNVEEKSEDNGNGNGNGGKA